MTPPKILDVYKRQVYEIAIADTNLELIKTAQEKFGISSKDCYDNYDDMLKDDAIDAIHIVTPPSTHAEFSIKALKAGKHCGCTIPMGMSIQELEDVIKARIESQKQYMFMETTVFGREYFYVKDLLDQGKFGKIQYMTCAHYQDMDCLLYTSPRWRERCVYCSRKEDGYKQHPYPVTNEIKTDIIGTGIWKQT